MCYKHWGMVPLALQRQIYAAYRAGQEVDKQPSKKYLGAIKKAIAEVARRENPRSYFPKQSKAKVADG